MPEKVVLNAKCKNCGGESFKIPSSPQPNDMITCANCGATARYGDVRKFMREEGAKIGKKVLADAIAKAGFKIKP